MTLAVAFTGKKRCQIGPAVKIKGEPVCRETTAQSRLLQTVEESRETVSLPIGHTHYRVWESAVLNGVHLKSDAELFTLLRTANFMQDDVVISCIAKCVGKRISSALDAKLAARSKQGLCFRSTDSGFSRSTSSSERHSPFEHLPNPSNYASPKGRRLFDPNIDSFLTEMNIRFDHALMARLAATCTKPLALLLRHLPPATHIICVLSRISCEGSLDLSFQLHPNAITSDYDYAGMLDQPAILEPAPSPPASPKIPARTGLAINPPLTPEQIEARKAKLSSAQETAGTPTTVSTNVASNGTPPHTRQLHRSNSSNVGSAQMFPGIYDAMLSKASNPARPWEDTTSSGGGGANAVFKHAKANAAPLEAANATFDRIQPAFPFLTSLKSLDISHNRMENCTLQALLPSLTQLTALTALDITDNEISAVGFAHIALMLPTLRALRAGFNQIRDRDAIGAPLSRLPALQLLDLSGNILSGSISMLRVFLTKMSSLTSLDLSDCGLDVDDLKQIAPAFRAMPALTDLNLGRNRVAGCKGALNGLIQQLVHVRRLHMCGMCLGNRGIQDMEPVLEKLTELQHLDLRTNGVDKDDLKTFSDRLLSISVL